MNIGIQDGLNLAWKLSRTLGGAPEDLLDTYEEERRPIALRILGATLQRDSTSSGPRSAAKSLIGAVTKQASVNNGTQLDVHYRESPLSRNFAEVTAVRAGDRAPDAPVMLYPGGNRVRLFELLRDRTRFTLLQFTSDTTKMNPHLDSLVVRRIEKRDTLANGDRPILLDIHGHAYDAYGVGEDAVVLIRPDGYISATGTADQIPEILQHLKLATA